MRKKLILGIVLLMALVLSAATASALTDMERLGGLIYRDTDLSLNYNQSCQTCHHPSAGFEDPVNRHDPENFPVSQGSDPSKYGGRNAPTSAYAGFSPEFYYYYDGEQKIYVGGMFWDGRATGAETGDPLADQAGGPFQNPVEMGIDSTIVVTRVSTSTYADLFLSVFPDTDWTNIDGTFNNVRAAIAAYERSTAVTRFNSKFDQFWQACTKVGIAVDTIDETTTLKDLPQGILSTGELKGLALFNGKAGCAACHSTSDYEKGTTPPLFTDYTYDNIGIPTNQRVYDLAGGAPPDLGLGGILGEADQNGKFKVPTLRNVAKSAPYGHNGYFVTLDEIVNFYNTRNLETSEWYNNTAEYPLTVNIIEIGDLGLSPKEEQWIVAFLHTLTDTQTAQ